MNRKEHITDAATPATVTDEVVALGMRLNAARVLESETELKEFSAAATKDYMGGFYLDRAVVEASDEAEALRGMLPYVKAISLTGAAIQINEALNLVDLILDRFPSDGVTALVEQDGRRLRRLLYSSLDAIDGAADQKLSDVVSEILNPNLNPWVPVADRIAAVRAAR